MGIIHDLVALAMLAGSGWCSTMPRANSWRGGREGRSEE